MKNKIDKCFLLALLLLPFFTFSQQDQSVVMEIPSPPIEEVVQTIQKRSYFWIPGQWVFEKNTYNWIPGYWERKKAGYVFVSGKWIEKNKGYIWQSGFWKKINLDKWLMMYS